MKRNKDLIFKIFFLVYSCLLIALSFEFFRNFNVFNKLPSNSFLYINDQIYFHALIIISLTFFCAFFIFIDVYYKKGIVNKYNKIFLFLSIGIAIISIFIMPATSTDFYTYICQSRVFSVFNQNPYIVSYDTFPNDVFFLYRSIWTDSPAVYGPVLFFILNVVEFFFRDNILMTFLAFKFLIILSHIGVIFLMNKLIENKKYIYLYALNPLFILSILIDGHIDVFIFFLTVLAYYFISKKENIYWAIFCLTIAALIKITLILPLSLLFFYLLIIDKDIKQKIKEIMISLFIFVFLLFISYYVFWEGVVIFDPLLIESKKSTCISSIFFLFVLKIVKSFSDNWLVITNFILKVIFVISYLCIVIKMFLKRKSIRDIDLLKYWAIILIIFNFLSSWTMPWHFILPIIFILIYFEQIKNKMFYKIILIILFLYLIFISLLLI